MIILLLIFSALFMLFFGMSIMFIIYICIMWSMALQQHQQLRADQTSASKTSIGGLTEAELERLGGAQDGAELDGVECVVCLDDIEEGQIARVLPECRHVFHRECADKWLAVHSDCPLCRANLAPVRSELPSVLMSSPSRNVGDDEGFQVVVS